MTRARRALGVTQLALGAAALLRPRTVPGFVGGPQPDPRIVRVLGARQVVQGAVTLAVPSRDVVCLGSLVDALHAGSLLPLLGTRYRRAALVSGVLALSTAAAGRRVART